MSRIGIPDEPSQIVAVLGPTNTGKTHLAIEHMIGHRSGMIGLPLRLLAREVFDRFAKLRPRDEIALITGEERIIPPGARYWVCTVEAMPLSVAVEFLAVDEIQLAASYIRVGNFPAILIFEFMKAAFSATVAERLPLVQRHFR